MSCLCHFGKIESLLFFSREFCPYATLGRTASGGGLFTKILLAAFFRFLAVH